MTKYNKTKKQYKQVIILNSRVRTVDLLGVLFYRGELSPFFGVSRALEAKVNSSSIVNSTAPKKAAEKECPGKTT